jgi:hypothetical protein
MQDAAQAIVSTDVEMRDRVWIGDRSVVGAPAGSSRSPDEADGVVMPLKLAKGVQQMCSVLDQHAVE